MSVIMAIVGVLVSAILIVALILIWRKKDQSESGTKDEVANGVKDIVLYSPPLRRGDWIRKYLRGVKMPVLIRTRSSNTSSTKKQWSGKNILIAVSILILLGVVVGSVVSQLTTAMVTEHSGAIAETPELLAQKAKKASELKGVYITGVVVLAVMALARSTKSKSTISQWVKGKSLNSTWERVSKLFEQQIGTGDNNPNNDRLLRYPIIFVVAYYAIPILFGIYSPDFMYRPWDENRILFFIFIPGSMLLLAFVKSLKRGGLTGIVGVLLFLCFAFAGYFYIQPIRDKFGTSFSASTLPQTQMAFTTPNYSDDGDTIFIGAPANGEWSSTIAIDSTVDFSITATDCVNIRPNRSVARQVSYCPGDKIEIGEVAILQFQSNCKRDVTITVRLSPKSKPRLY
jgi:hypothetical protein